MTRSTKRTVALLSLIAVAIVTSGCELSLSVADCSWIDQPDMGGLVCLGVNLMTIVVSAVAILGVVLLGLGGAFPA